MNHTPLGLWPKRKRAAAYGDAMWRNGYEITGRPPHEAKAQKDCAVIAMAHALRITYDEAHAQMKARGRRDGKATSGLGNMLRTDSRFIMLDNVRAKCKTVGAFVARFNRGRYVVRVSGHAFAVVDGIALDHSWRPLRRIDWVAQVKESN